MDATAISNALAAVFTEQAKLKLEATEIIQPAKTLDQIGGKG